MYRTAYADQLSFENFYLPFGGKLSRDNRWVKLADLIPWKELELDYARQFSEDIEALAMRVNDAVVQAILDEETFPKFPFSASLT